MSRPGTKPKPAELRAIEGGTARKGSVSRRPIPEPTLLSPRITELPAPPRDLPPEGVELWEGPCALLAAHGVLTLADVPAILVMCRHYAMMERVRKVLDRQGYFDLGSTGQMVGHPGVKIFNEASSSFLRYASEFGMTPSTRARIGLTDVARRTLAQDLEERLGPNPRRV